jgi:hypothetical protein
MVRRGQDSLDILDSHVEATETADDLRRGDLSGGVAAVPRPRVDVDRFEKPYLVVVAQRLHAEVRDPGELSDRQGARHARQSPPSPYRRVKTK